MRQLTTDERYQQVGSEYITLRNLGLEPKNAKKVLNALLNTSFRKYPENEKTKLLKLGVAITDDQQSYTSKPEVNDDAKNIKLPPASQYQSFDQCKKSLTDAGIDSDMAENHCRKIPGSPNYEGPGVTTEMFGKRSGNNKLIEEKRISNLYGASIEKPAWMTILEFKDKGSIDGTIMTTTNLKSASSQNEPHFVTTARFRGFY